VYAGLVLLATQVLQFHDSVAVAASTLLEAALFSSLRRRVQRTVDQRFNRARYFPFLRGRQVSCARAPVSTGWLPDYDVARPATAGSAGGSLPGAGANHIETAVGWNASLTTPTRSCRTASRSTVCLSRPLNSATTASAL